MFVVTANPTFTHTVTSMTPIDGGHKEEKFKATFRVVPTDEANKFDLSDGTESKEFLRTAIVSLGDLVDEQKEAVPYSDDLRDQLLQLSYVRAGLARAYFEAVTKAKSGN